MRRNALEKAEEGTRILFVAVSVAGISYKERGRQAIIRSEASGGFDYNLWRRKAKCSGMGVACWVVDMGSWGRLTTDNGLRRRLVNRILLAVLFSEGW